MLVIGIDPGTAITGYGIIEQDLAGEMKLIDYGVIRTPSDLPMPDRLVLIYDDLTRIISKYEPVSGAVEKLFFQKNVKTALSVGQARGIILLALAKAGVSVADYSPNEVKLAVSGYGGAGKRQIQEMVKTLLNIDKIPQPDDAADALAVAICHLQSSSFQSRLENRE